MNNYKKILEEILEYEKKFVVIWGCSDVISDNFGGFKFKNISKENFWKVIGRGDDREILESLKEETLNVYLEGEYEFKSIMKWEPPDYDSYGRCIYPGSLIVEHIELILIQTFTQRVRNSKLENLFY
jgi:hypothetical protein